MALPEGKDPKGYERGGSLCGAGKQRKSTVKEIFHNILPSAY